MLNDVDGFYFILSYSSARVCFSSLPSSYRLFSETPSQDVVVGVGLRTTLTGFGDLGLRKEESSMRSQRESKESEARISFL